MRRNGLVGRNLGVHMALSVLALAALGFGASLAMERRTTDAFRDRLVSQARIIEALVVRDGLAEASAIADVAGRGSRARVTIVGRDGAVAADSQAFAPALGNQASRPEIRAALSGEIGTDRRTSEMLGIPFYFLAVPSEADFVVRTALPAAILDSQIADIRRDIALMMLGAFLFVVALSATASRSVSRALGDLGRTLTGLRDGVRPAPSTRGPAEIRAVRDTAVAMAGELARRIEEIRKETGLREQVLSSMTEGVILAEASGSIVYANPAAQRLLGNPRTLPSHLAGPGVHDFDLHHPQRVSVRATTLELDDARLLSVVQNVTEARRVEAMRRDFVADASHELKTPVASILATSETLERALWDDPANATRFAGTLTAEARRLARLVGDLLDLARLEKEPSAGTQLSLSQVVVREAERARPGAEAKGLDLLVEVASDIEVMGDENDIELAVRNLIDNAIRYTDAGRVAVRLAARAGRAKLEITDTGSGIPTKELPRIFERFYRVDKARSRDTGGTGLGLAIAKHVAEAHGGDVKARSELGAGSSFVATFPAIPRKRKPRRSSPKPASGNGG